MTTESSGFTDGRYSTLPGLAGPSAAPGPAVMRRQSQPGHDRHDQPARPETPTGTHCPGRTGAPARRTSVRGTLRRRSGARGRSRRRRRIGRAATPATPASSTKILNGIGGGSMRRHDEHPARRSRRNHARPRSTCRSWNRRRKQRFPALAADEIEHVQPGHRSERSSSPRSRASLSAIANRKEHDENVGDFRQREERRVDERDDEQARSAQRLGQRLSSRGRGRV